MKKKILVIDDEPSFCEMLNDFLGSAGYEVSTAGDGEEALEMLKHLRPDLIILDIQMPKMGGLAFYDRISAPSGKSKHPVIVLTARMNLEELFKELQVEAFVPKPVKLEELLQRVQNVLIKNQIAAVFPKTVQKAKKILVVENEKEKFDGIVGELTAAGFLVCGVKNGVEAIVRAPQERPDVVLAKLNLPDISGDTLAVQLKQLLPVEAKIVLYTTEDYDWRSILTQKVFEKTSVAKLVESDNPQELAKQISKLFEP